MEFVLLGVCNGHVRARNNWQKKWLRNYYTLEENKIHTDQLLIQNPGKVNDQTGDDTSRYPVIPLPVSTCKTPCAPPIELYVLPVTICVHNQLNCVLRVTNCYVSKQNDAKHDNLLKLQHFNSTCDNKYSIRK